MNDSRLAAQVASAQAHPAAAVLDCGKAGGDADGATGGTAGTKLEKNGERSGDGLVDGDMDTEGLTDGGPLGVNSTKPVGEGTFSAAAADCAELRGGASPAVSPRPPPGLSGSLGGWTGAKTDWMAARVGDRPTAKGDGSLGRATGAGPAGTVAAEAAGAGSETPSGEPGG